MTQKIIFLDVDGTLVDYHNRIPASAVTAIRQARANGHRVYVCTGRSRAEMQEEIWEIGIDGMIGGNGSYVEDDGKVILHQLIAKDEAIRVVDWLQERGLAFYLESNNGLFASDDFRAAAPAVMAEYVNRKGIVDPKEQEQATTNFLDQMTYGADLYRDDLNKISFILSSYQDHLDSIQAFPNLEAHTWGGRGETALFGDLGVKGINKAQAVDALLAYLGTDRRDTIAFGDAKIDIPMLDYCEIGVAMGNGGEEILAMADKVTADVEDDGLYKAFVDLELI